METKKTTGSTISDGQKSEDKKAKEFANAVGSLIKGIADDSTRMTETCKQAIAELQTAIILWERTKARPMPPEFEEIIKGSMDNAVRILKEGVEPRKLDLTKPL